MAAIVTPVWHGFSGSENWALKAQASDLWNSGQELGDMCHPADHQSLTKFHCTGCFNSQRVGNFNWTTGDFSTSQLSGTKQFFPPFIRLNNVESQMFYERTPSKWWLLLASEKKCLKEENLSPSCQRAFTPVAAIDQASSISFTMHNPHVPGSWSWIVSRTRTRYAKWSRSEEANHRPEFHPPLKPQLIFVCLAILSVWKTKLVHESD